MDKSAFLDQHASHARLESLPSPVICNVSHALQAHLLCKWQRLLFVIPAMQARIQAKIAHQSAQTVLWASIRMLLVKDCAKTVNVVFTAIWLKERCAAFVQRCSTLMYRGKRSAVTANMVHKTMALRIHRNASRCGAIFLLLMICGTMHPILVSMKMESRTMAPYGKDSRCI